MTPHRLQLKYFIDEPDASDSVALDAFVPVFHRWIQRNALGGLLIDVADYKHVPNGPGTVLIGHSADYGIERIGGRLGLRYTRKRSRDGSLSDALLAAFDLTLQAARLLQSDHTLKDRLAFPTDTFEVALLDQLRYPNRETSLRLIRNELTTVLARIYGDDATIRLTQMENDSRLPFTLRVHVPEADPLDTLAERLERGVVTSGE